MLIVRRTWEHRVHPEVVIEVRADHHFVFVDLVEVHALLEFELEDLPNDPAELTLCLLSWLDLQISLSVNALFKYLERLVISLSCLWQSC